jgi:hypothetical protein
VTDCFRRLQDFFGTSGQGMKVNSMVFYERPEILVRHQRYPMAFPQKAKGKRYEGLDISP